MTRERDAGGVEGGASAVLRAVGSLLVALSGGDERAFQRAAAATRPPEPEPAPQPRIEPHTPFPTTSYEGSEDDIELVLRDARERAQQIIDDSLRRAEDLVVRSRPETSFGRTEDDAVQRSIADITMELRLIQQRLARIEALLEARPAAAPRPPEADQPAEPPRPVARPFAARPEAAVPPIRPPEPIRQEPPRAEPRQPEPPREVTTPPPPPPMIQEIVPRPVPGPRQPEPAPPGPPSPPSPPPHDPGEPPSPPSTPTAPDAEAPARPQSPFAPPRTEEWAARPSPAPAPPRSNGQTPVPFAPSAARLSGGGEAPLATFSPEDGALLVRVTPVSGFQALMRVQDALNRAQGIRQATVEAYAQGEARLRVELSEHTDSDELLAGLRSTLGQSVRIREASEADRSLLIVLG